jgi:hypothetical protein
VVVSSGVYEEGHQIECVDKMHQESRGATAG